MQLNTVEELIDDIRQGKMVILMDDEDRENEGDLIIAAEQVRPDDINFMATHARGLICLTLTEERCRQLDLPLMVSDNRAAHSTNFTVSIEAAEGVSTGISAADRARTVRAAVARDAQPKDIVQPGHIFPLKAEAGGVLSRAGHTEAGCDLARLAGFEPAAAIVEIMNEDGTMARRADLEKFAQIHNLKIGTIADMIQYRTLNEKTVECVNERNVSTEFGDFSLRTYLDKPRQEKHFALVKGDIQNQDSVLVRVHNSDTARDVLGILRESDKTYKPWSFQRALQKISEEGSGVVILLCHNETTDDIEESIDWMISGKQQRPSQDMVYKSVGTGSQILQDLGVHKMRLMSAPFKFSALSGFQLEVEEYLNCE
ncbi:bifunctional 3,4-dihydroxy-2-butanone-4-phosphate synthase/GTP cyclohydrolase II [Pseudoteredinibacter isoporae]|uniref:3,4-dihydroxy-2-butanone 4-phosphate synthase n=1 Tax=Pseudoteredinibacter isoporae TaxID=570281 RepID=A0A7X0JR94_9GAMM|nr:bifunctional 3,4-dihydroxy-2-butanone-4-phosphate synthase/GTP cyclohydrolase II [Pseudoteredinibacter isoporae]MBB6520827.1 3,4-dihydroxy 2-butanone 4-phosphate synthase/GTP cyclohydrolase II [Pseudoteredinibacter isoporae]NHO86393.1 3,4-dihydroxy-2-butanone-4-phosphate synthase [Pseudoteredinibacter isoporae]NIB25155.1 3,4-dihydroxy-2-butanone-4-phosphate synthase [Pseudoteredinibacter isoporae]